MLKTIPMKIILFSIVMVFTLINCKNPNIPLIIGHRGAKGHIVENTLESIEKALELGVDGIEIDIFKCKSGELVVFHDKTLNRLTDAEGLIESLDIDSIRKIKILNKYKIPTLNEVLDLIDGKVFLNIELKGSETALLTNQIIKNYLDKGNWIIEKFIISSFNWKELEIFYKNNKQVPIAVLTDADPLDALPVARKLKAKAINPSYKSLNSKNVKKIHEAGYKIYPYTVNKKENISKVISLNVDGIITDFPERVQELIFNL
jgi:glycerophosphoryl diester phosphodiesterase